ncbi:MAG: sodium ion-translocating decarboxylase subunit beta, partial [Aristaeellaceae bacterium]
MQFIIQSLKGLWETSGVCYFVNDPKALIMIGIACFLLYLAIARQFEPLLLLPIAFGMLLTNLLGSEVFHEELFAGGHANWGLFGGAALLDGNAIKEIGNYWVSANGDIFTNETNLLLGHFVNSVAFAENQFRMPLADALAQLAANNNAASIVLESTYYLSGTAVMSAEGTMIAAEGGKYISAGLLDYLYLGVKLGIYPCLIFMGVGAGTDFGPLISNPKTLLLGAAAQAGIFLTFIAAVLMGFTPAEASSIGIIGGADGPTAIWLTGKLAPHLLGPIAVAAYCYMALVPVIQPPIMRLLTTKK